MVGLNVASRRPAGDRRLRVEASAKVNLAIEVLGKRPDGYHEIVTVLQTVDLADRLTMEAAPELELVVRGRHLPADGSNLALRAAERLRKAAGVDRGARIVLDKRIPVAAGLGGGSSDAAAVLVGLNRLWRLGWSVRRLEAVAVELGMDVPFFLRGGVALGSARGERLERLRGVALALVLVNPGVGIATADAYGRMTPDMFTDGSHVRALVVALRRRHPASVARALYNGLEPAQVSVVKVIARVKAALLAAGALAAAMSGSGPTVFGLARSLEHARQLRARVARSGWECWAVRTSSGPAVRLGSRGTR